MDNYTPYDHVIEKTFCGMDRPVVADLIKWLTDLPPDAPVSTHVLLRFSFDDNVLTIQEVDDL